jgi:Mg2+-importing ATPase
MIAGAAIPYLPIGSYFGFVPLPLSFWVWIIVFLLSYAALTHSVKVWFHRKFGID